MANPSGDSDKPRGVLGWLKVNWPLTLVGCTLLAAAATTLAVDPPATARDLRSPLLGEPSRIARGDRAPAPPPPGLQEQLEALAKSYREPVGVAVTEVERGWIVSSGGEDLYPQQSVSKLWVTLTVLDQVDRGELALDSPVMVWPEDRSVFSQPVTQMIGRLGYPTTVEDLVRRSLIQSDNAANDKLIEVAGGVEAVSEALAAKQLDDIRIGADEKNLQSTIAGLVWDPKLAGWRFKEAREKLPPLVREAALNAYLADPLDGASPVGIVQALAALKRGELLSPAGTQVMLSYMAQSTTGPLRLRGGLPLDWKIAHKTGTGQDFGGASVGINDVALLTAPDERVYAVAVMMPRTWAPVPRRLAFMQSVSRLVVASWAADSAASGDPPR